MEYLSEIIARLRKVHERLLDPTALSRDDCAEIETEISTLASALYGTAAAVSAIKQLRPPADAAS